MVISLHRLRGAIAVQQSWGSKPNPSAFITTPTAAQDRLTGHPTVDGGHQAPMGPAMATGRGRAGSHAHPESGTPRRI